MIGFSCSYIGLSWVLLADDRVWISHIGTSKLSSRYIFSWNAYRLGPGGEHWEHNLVRKSNLSVFNFENVLRFDSTLFAREEKSTFLPESLLKQEGIFIQVVRTGFLCSRTKSSSSASISIESATCHLLRIDLDYFLDGYRRVAQGRHRRKINQRAIIADDCTNLWSLVCCIYDGLLSMNSKTERNSRWTVHTRFLFCSSMRRSYHKQVDLDQIGHPLGGHQHDMVCASRPDQETKIDEAYQSWINDEAHLFS